MNRCRDPKSRFTRTRTTPTTNSPTPSHGTIRVTPLSNPSVGRILRGGRLGRIVTAQTKGKIKVGEGSSKERIPEISQEAIILSSNPQEQELINGQTKITLS